MKKVDTWERRGPLCACWRRGSQLQWPRFQADRKHTDESVKRRPWAGVAVGTSALMSALVCEHWPESYTATSVLELPSLDLDIKWEGGSHEEDAIRLLKSIMEPAVKDAEPARRSRRHLERRVRRQSEDGGLAKRAKEFQQEVEVVVLDEEKTETGDKSSFFLPSPPASFSTQVVPSGEHYH